MLTTTIDALKGRDMDVVDTPGEYLSANIDNGVCVVMKGTLADLMVASNPALY